MNPVDTTRMALRQVTCPTCAGPSVFAPVNPFRPFCSQRCQQIDLGAWASEQFAVAAPEPPDLFDAAFPDTAAPT